MTQASLAYSLRKPYQTNKKHEEINGRSNCHISTNRTTQHLKGTNLAFFDRSKSENHEKQGEPDVSESTLGDFVLQSSVKGKLTYRDAETGDWRFSATPDGGKEGH